MRKYVVPYEPGVYHVGENNNNSILSEEQVRAIKLHLKNRTRTYQQLADRYRVSLSTISAIQQGRRWPHVEV